MSVAQYCGEPVETTIDYCSCHNVKLLSNKATLRGKELHQLRVRLPSFTHPLPFCNKGMTIQEKKRGQGNRGGSVCPALVAETCGLAVKGLYTALARKDIGEERDLKFAILTKGMSELILCERPFDRCVN